MRLFNKKADSRVERSALVPGYFVKTPQEVEDELQTSIEHGLSNEDVNERIARYGPNVIQGSEGVKIHVLLAQHTFNFMQGVSNHFPLITGSPCLSNRLPCSARLDQWWCYLLHYWSEHCCWFLSRLSF